MNKLIEILLLGSIGVIEIISLGLSYIISLIYLLLMEIVGTHKFNKKFKVLNKLVINEFRKSIKSFKDLYERI